jgi:hypothetical protein
MFRGDEQLGEDQSLQKWLDTPEVRQHGLLVNYRIIDRNVTWYT